MEEHGDQQHIGTGYPQAQLAGAAATAETHPDPAARERASARIARWTSVITGMLRGDLVIGSRTPVKDLPAWVTPEVVHGGFATGGVAAGGPLTAWEIGYAGEHALPHDRAAIFHHQAAHATTPEGYRITVPEEAVLPVLGWLLNAGEQQAAAELLATVAPFSARLRFSPEPAPPGGPGPDLVWRETAGTVRDALLRRGPRPRIEAMRATLRVWNLYADQVLQLWLETAEHGRVGVHLDDERRRAARGLLDRFAELAALFPPSRRHAGPKANLTVLRTALEDVLAGRQWRRGLVQTVVDAMVARRGAPGSPRHTELRARQAAVAAAPPHHEIARAVAERMADLPAHTGVTDVERLLSPVGGTAVPDRVRVIVRRAAAGPVEELIANGLVPSAEVLAGLVPRIAARTVADAYPDPALRDIMAANYLAFRNRRSLLLTDLRSQVRLDELPWVRAVGAHRRAGAGTRAAAAATLRRLGGLTLGSFPGTLLPNPMVRELAAVSREADLRLPWLEELAADIFDGRFTAKFLAAAKIAGRLLGGTVYERYYGIDYPAVLALPDPAPAGRGPAVSAAFAELCRERAGSRRRRGRPAENGMVIEQAQILTTHNLATLVHAGAALAPDGADRCWDTAQRLARRLDGPGAHRVVKDIAYAWRQLIFHLAVTGEAAAFVAGRTADGPLGPALTGLRDAVEGRPARPLTGWTTSRHWLLPER